MKTKLFLFGVLCFNLSIGQNSLSLGTVNSFATTGANAPVATEIFRFRPGLVTQIQDGVGFGFGATNRWFSFGSITQGTQTFYGSRFQTPNNALVMGYTSSNVLNPNVNPNNPRIEWIGNGLNTGNLECRGGLGFGSPGIPGSNRLIASMTKDGNTIFSNNTAFVNANTDSKVSIQHTTENGLTINSAASSGGDRTGIKIFENNGLLNNTGIEIVVQDPITNPFGSTLANYGLNINASGLSELFGVRSITNGGGISNEYAIFGATTNNNGDQYAGYFNGDVYISGTFGPSDAKLKDNIKQEISVLGKLAKLKPVSYDYKKMADLNLPKGLQHGFIAQELAEVFPELTKDIKHPVFNKEGKRSSTIEFKSVNYNGLISVLTAGIQELNDKVTKLESQLAERTEKSSLKTANGLIENTKVAFMEQNIPNPFSDQTTIRYQLPEGTTTAEIMVFDLNGRLIKNYPINNNQAEITIKASEIGSGLFIYSLVQNGQELLTKKMIVK